MSTELTQQTGGGMIQKPEFLSEIAKEDQGTELLSQYVSPPFIKIVQNNSKEPYNQYETGSVLAVPQNVKLFDPQQVFHVTPVFMYPEYVLTNPYPLKHLSFIRERSLNPEGDLAARCRDFSNRMIVCPEAPADKQQDTKYQCTYFEHLNFVCVIHEHEVFNRLPIVFTFRSGEFKTGKKFAGLIKMRGDVPICSGVFAASTGIHSVSGNENFGLNFDNPNPEEGMAPWLDEGRFRELFEIHKELKRLHNQGSIQVSYEDETAEVDATADSPEM